MTEVLDNSVSPDVSLEQTEIVTNTPEPVATDSVVEDVKVEDVGDKVVKSFLDDLPEELRNDKSLKDFKDINSLAKSYVEQKKFIGKRIEDLSESEVKSLYGKMGVPDSVEGYGIEISQDNPDKVVLDGFINKAHELNLTKSQTEALVEYANKLSTDASSSSMADITRLKDEQIAQLKADLGPEFENRTKAANKALSHFGGDELIKAIKDANMDSNPALVKAFAEIGMRMSEDKVVANRVEKHGETSEEAFNKIREFEQEYFNAIYNGTHKDHKWAVEERNRLYGIASSYKK